MEEVIKRLGFKAMENVVEIAEYSFSLGVIGEEVTGLVFTLDNNQLYLETYDDRSPVPTAVISLGTADTEEKLTNIIKSIRALN